MEYKSFRGQSFALQNLHNRRNQVKILDIHSPARKNSIIREHAALDFPARILLGNFEKLLPRPLFVGITMLNGPSTRCTMYSVNENIVLPTRHTHTYTQVARVHAVSLSHTISTASRCNDAAVSAFCGDRTSYIFRDSCKGSCLPFANRFVSLLIQNIVK